jgi:hypothetical protein
MLRRRTASQGGYLIIIALSLLFTLLILALGLARTGNQALLLYLDRQSRDMEEQSVELAQARIEAALQGDSVAGWSGFPPTGEQSIRGDNSMLGVGFEFSSTDSSMSLHRPPDNAYSQNVSQRDDVVEVGYHDSLIRQAGNDIPVPPWHTAVVLQGPKDRYVTVYGNTFGYGAYAPQGNVTLDQMGAWANPTFKEAKAGQPKFSGIPVMVRALNEINISGSFPHGTAVSSNGPVIVQGGAYAHTGPLPLDVYSTQLVNSINGAYDRISGVAINRTLAFRGDPLGISLIAALFSGDMSQLEGLCSLRQALGFPFPPYVSVQNKAPAFIAYHLHVPFPPDRVSFSAPEDPTAIMVAKHDERMQKVAERDKLKADLADKQSQLDAYKAGSTDYQNAHKSEMDDLQKQIDDDNKQIADLNSQIDGIDNALKKQADDLSSYADSVKNTVKVSEEPVTKADEKAYATKRGKKPKGWQYPYAAVFGHLGELIKSLLTFDLPGIQQALAPNIRLVHFVDGPPPNYQDGDLNGHIKLQTTLTVPRGRALKLDGDVELIGDVWVQRGASLTVSGNLTLEPRDGSAATRPRGRITLEEGATLLVGGDLTVEGAPYLGSVTVCGPVDKTHPITAAIICKGTVDLKYGVFPGVMLDDLFGALGMADVKNNLLTPFLADIAPNIAKIYGVFFKRTCWFAYYCATFMQFPFLADIPLPGMQVLAAVPFPIPAMKRNMERSIFSPLTYFYQIELNARLGEYLYTEATYWIFGRGVVPSLPKVDPAVTGSLFHSVPGAARSARRRAGSRDTSEGQSHRRQSAQGDFHGWHQGRRGQLARFAGRSPRTVR